MSTSVDRDQSLSGLGRLPVDSREDLGSSRVFSVWIEDQSNLVSDWYVSASSVALTFLSSFNGRIEAIYVPLC